MFAGGSGIFAALSETQQRLASRLRVRYTRWDETNAQRQAEGLPKVQMMMVPDGTRLTQEAPHPAPGDTITAEHPLVRWNCRGEHQQGSIATTPSLLHSLKDTATGKVLGIEESRRMLAMLLRPGTAPQAGKDKGDYQQDEKDSLATKVAREVAGGGAAWAHRWKPGDFVCWDNRWMIHSTTTPLLWEGDRLMHRVRLPAPPV